MGLLERDCERQQLEDVLKIVYVKFLVDDISHPGAETPEQKA